MKIHHCSRPSLSMSFLVISLSTPQKVICFKVEMVMEALHGCLTGCCMTFGIEPVGCISYCQRCWSHRRFLLWPEMSYQANPLQPLNRDSLPPLVPGSSSLLPFSTPPPTSLIDISSHCNHRGQEASARHLLMNQTPLQHSCVSSQFPMMDRKDGAWGCCSHLVGLCCSQCFVAKVVSGTTTSDTIRSLSQK